MSSIQHDLLTLGDLRRVISLIKDAPDDVRIAFFEAHSTQTEDPRIEVIYVGSPARARLISIDIPPGDLTRLEDSAL